MVEINHNHTMVLLIGASDFPEDPSITPIPNVKANIAHFKETLVNPEIIGIPEANITVSLNETRSQIERKLLDICKQTNHKKYTLMVYYSGHGILSADDYELYLTTSQTSKKYLETDAVNINDFKRDIRRSAAGRKIVLLDCCHSGAILGTMGAHNSAIQVELMGFEGTYVMTSAAEDTPALFPVENPDRPTYFTGKLLEILDQGLESEHEFCSLREIYHQVETELLQAGLPRPQQSNINSADQLYFARNRRYVKTRPPDELAWEDALQKNNKWAFKDFRRQFPESNFAEEARQKIIYIEEEECWRKSIARNTISALDDYLDTYPTGRYVQEANKRLNELREEEEEERNWEQAVQAGDLVSFETYLEEYPQGKYLQKARVQIKKLKKEDKKKNRQEQAWQKILAGHLQDLEQKADKLKEQGHLEAALQLYYQVLDLQPDQQHILEAVNQCQQLLRQTGAGPNIHAHTIRQAGPDRVAKRRPELPGKPEHLPQQSHWTDQAKGVFLEVAARLAAIFKPADAPAEPVRQPKAAMPAEDPAADATRDRRPVPAAFPLYEPKEVAADPAVAPAARTEDAPDAAQQVHPGPTEYTYEEGAAVPIDLVDDLSPAPVQVTPDGSEEIPSAWMPEVPSDLVDDISPAAAESTSHQTEADLTNTSGTIPPGPEAASSPKEPIPEMAGCSYPATADIAPEETASLSDAAEEIPSVETEFFPDGAEEGATRGKEGTPEPQADPPVTGKKPEVTFRSLYKPLKGIYERNKKVILGVAGIGLLSLTFLIFKPFFRPVATGLPSQRVSPAARALPSYALLLADALYNQETYGPSLQLYEASSLDLNPEQMRRIAWIYEKGDSIKGLPPNMTRSFSWYAKAARAGNIKAMGKLGNFYYGDFGPEEAVKQNYDSAFYWFRLSALNGDISAMYNLSILYDYGLGVQANTDSAATWLNRFNNARKKSPVSP